MYQVGVPMALPCKLAHCIPVIFLMVLSLSVNCFGTEDFDCLDEWSEPQTVQESNTYFLENETFTVTCTLPACNRYKGFTAGDIGFYLEKRGAAPQACIPMSLVSVQNVTTARLTVNVSVEDAGAFACIVPNQNCSQALQARHDFKIVGYTNDIFVEHRPQAVIDFECFAYDWTEYMKCSWTHPEEYLKPKDISVDCNYMVLTDTKFDHPCPQLNYTNALWDADSFRAATYYFVEVGVTNTVVNLTISVTKEFKVNEIVKPSPIKDLIVLTDRAAPSCILLSWKHSKTYYNKVFRIKHQAEHQTDPDILATNWNQTSFKACGYGPMTEHWFTVDTLPIDPLSGYWSEQVTGSGWTVQTAPSVGPLISAGSYVSTKCKSGRRNVTFYWNDVPEKSRNGLIDSYILKVNEGDLTKNISSNVFSAVMALQCGACNVQIFAHNEGGKSLLPSTWEVGSAAETVPGHVWKIKNSFRVKLTSSSVIAVWDGSVHNDAVGGDDLHVTVFWCKGVRPDNLCQNDILWKRTRLSESVLKIEKALDNPRGYLYGISIESTPASGIFWTSCIYVSETEHPGIPVPKDVVVQSSGPGSLLLTWPMQTCTYETKAIVTGYVAKYCKEHECNDTSKIQKVDVPANVSHCTLSGLTTKQTYLLTVQSKSHRRFGVEAHPWKSAIVREGNEEASNVPLIIVITAAVFLVLAVLAVAFYMTRERCKKFKSLTLEQDFKDVILKDNPKRTPASSFQGNVIPSSECACDVPPEVPQRTVVSNSEPSVLFEVQDESVQDQADVTSGPDSSWWDNSGAPLIKEPVKGDKQKGKKNCKAAKTIPIDVVEMTDSPAGGSTVVSPSHSCHSNVELLPAESTAPTGFTVQENACPVHSVSKLSDATVITPSTVLVTHVPSQGYITGSNQQSLHCSSSSSSGSSRQNVNEYVVSEQSARPKDRPEDSDVIEAINFSPDYVTADSPSVLADSDLAVVPEVKVGRKLTEPHDMGMTSPSTGVYTNKLPLTDVDFPEERETQLTQGNNDQLGEISYSPHPVQAVALCEVGLPMYVQSGGGGTAHTASGVNGEEESLQRHDVGCLSLLDTGGVNQDRLCDSASDSELGSFDVPHSDDEGHNGEESSDEDRHYYDNRDNDDGYTVHID